MIILLSCSRDDVQSSRGSMKVRMAGESVCDDSEVPQSWWAEVSFAAGLLTAWTVAGEVAGSLTSADDSSLVDA
jgi:hypothetical protein